MPSDFCPGADRPRRFAASRRAALGGALALALGGLAPAAEAKKKKKKGCKFTTVGSMMTLTKSCTTTKSIQVPDGFTLDGAGFTIGAKGKSKGFAGAMIVGKTPTAGFTVANLILDGSGLPVPSGTNPGIDGIRFAGPNSSLQNNTVKNVTNNGNAVVASSATLDVGDLVVQDSYRGILVQGGTATLVRTTITGVIFAATVSGGATFVFKDSSSVASVTGAAFQVGGSTATIDGATIDSSGANTALFVSGQATVALTNSTVTASRNGVTVTSENASAKSTLNASGNTITLAAPALPQIYGIAYQSDTLGTADHNAISGFIDSDSGHFGCGIYVAPDGTGGVVIGPNNTFPNPPGNDTNICDERAP